MRCPIAIKIQLKICKDCLVSKWIHLIQTLEKIQISERLKTTSKVHLYLISDLDGYESFEISSFAESKNINQNSLSSYFKFPAVNAPSYELGQETNVEKYEENTIP